MKVELLQQAGHDELDQFCLLDSRTLIYSSTDYIRLIANETDSEPFWVTVSESSTIKAALPLLVKQGALGPVVNSLAYFGSNGGIISKDTELDSKKAVIEEYKVFCQSINACSSTIITNPLLKDSDFYEKHLPFNCRDQRIGQFTFFPEDTSHETLLKSFENPRPRNIRKGIRSGLDIEVSQTGEAIEYLHKVHNQNISAIGGLTKSLEFFLSLQKFLPTDAWNIYLAKLEGKYIAALLILYGNKTVEYYTPCVEEEFRSTQALSLLIFESMKDAMDEGYKQWNWGGTWLTQDGVYAFKKKWNTLDIPYYYYTTIYSDSLKSSTKKFLLEEYPGFFVLPFSELERA